MDFNDWWKESGKELFDDHIRCTKPESVCRAIARMAWDIAHQYDVAADGFTLRQCEKCLCMTNHYEVCGKCGNRR